MRILALTALALGALSACTASVESLGADASGTSADAGAAPDATAPDARPRDAAAADIGAVPDAAAPEHDAGAPEDAGAAPCGPVILSETEEDVTSAVIVPEGTGWRTFRTSAVAGSSRVFEQPLDRVGQFPQVAMSLGMAERVEVHHGGGGYAVVFGANVLLGPAPERRLNVGEGTVVAYRRHADGSHALVRHVRDHLEVDTVLPDGRVHPGATIPLRVRELQAAAISPTALAVVGTTTTSDMVRVLYVHRLADAATTLTDTLPSTLLASDATRVVWHDARQEWLIAHSVQREGTRYGDAHLSFYGGAEVLRRPLGSWGAWYGAPIAVVATNVGYALVWQTAESPGGGSSGWNDVLLAAQVDAHNLWSVEAAAPPELLATGRVPPHVAWNPTTHAVGRLWIHRVGEFPPGRGRGQLVFDCVGR